MSRLTPTKIFHKHITQMNSPFYRYRWKRGWGTLPAYVVLIQLSIFEFEYFLSPGSGQNFHAHYPKIRTICFPKPWKIILLGKAWLTTCLLTRWKFKSWSCRALASCTSRAENALIKKKKERQIIKGFLKRRTSHVQKLIMQMGEKV